MDTIRLPTAAAAVDCLAAAVGLVAVACQTQTGRSTVQVWRDCNNWASAFQTLRGHRRPVTAIAFPPAAESSDDTYTLCTASQDKVILWTLDALSASPQRSQPSHLSDGHVLCDTHGGPVSALRFSTTGAQLAVSVSPTDSDASPVILLFARAAAVLYAGPSASKGSRRRSRVDGGAASTRSGIASGATAPERSVRGTTRAPPAWSLSSRHSGSCSADMADMDFWQPRGPVEGVPASALPELFLAVCGDGVFTVSVPWVTGAAKTATAIARPRETEQHRGDVLAAALAQPNDGGGVGVDGAAPRTLLLRHCFADLPFSSLCAGTPRSSRGSLPTWSPPTAALGPVVAAGAGGIVQYDAVAGTALGQLAFFVITLNSHGLLGDTDAAVAPARVHGWPPASVAVDLVAVIDVAAGVLRPCLAATSAHDHGWSSEDDSDDDVDLPAWAAAASPVADQKSSVCGGAPAAHEQSCRGIRVVKVRVCGHAVVFSTAAVGHCSSPPAQSLFCVRDSRLCAAFAVGPAATSSAATEGAGLHAPASFDVPAMVSLRSDVDSAVHTSSDGNNFQCQRLLPTGAATAQRPTSGSEGGGAVLSWAVVVTSGPSGPPSLALAHALTGQPDVHVVALWAVSQARGAIEGAFVSRSPRLSFRDGSRDSSAHERTRIAVSPVTSPRTLRGAGPFVPSTATVVSAAARSSARRDPAARSVPVRTAEADTDKREEIDQDDDDDVSTGTGFELDEVLAAATHGAYIAAVFPETPAPEGSVLYLKKLSPRKQLEQRRAKMAAGKKKGRRGVVHNRPVVFNPSRIKSSGYGKPVPFVKGGPMPKKKQSSSAGDGGGGGVGVLVKALSRKYPTSCRVLASFQPQHALPPPGAHGAAVKMCAYSPCGLFLATAAVDQTARILRLPVQRHRGAGHTLLAHKAPVRSVAWSSDSKFALTAGDDRQVCLWSLERGGSDPLFSLRHVEGLAPPAVSVTKNVRASKGGGNAVLGYMPRHRRVSTAPASSSASTSAAAFTPFPNDVRRAIFTYSDQFVALCMGNSLCLFSYGAQQFQSKNELDNLRRRSLCRLARRWQAVDTQSILDIAGNNGVLSPVMLAANSNGSVTVWDLAVERPALTIRRAHARAVQRLALPQTTPFVTHTPSHYDVFATCAPDHAGGTIKLWDLRQQRHVRTLRGGHTNRSQEIGTAFSPCMRYIASGSEDRAAHIYDIGTGKPVARLTGHKDVVVDVSWHPLHPQLATTSFDGTVRFYTEVDHF